MTLIAQQMTRLIRTKDTAPPLLWTTTPVRLTTSRETQRGWTLTSEEAERSRLTPTCDCVATTERASRMREARHLTERWLQGEHRRPSSRIGRPAKAGAPSALHSPDGSWWATQ